MEECNGFRNYETWCVNLWIFNDEYLYRELRSIALMTRHLNGAQFILADKVQEYFEELRPEPCTGPFSDLIGYSLRSRVDWLAIADHLLEDVAD